MVAIAKVENDPGSDVICLEPIRGAASVKASTLYVSNPDIGYEGRFKEAERR